MDNVGTITTATSRSDGRLKVSCPHGKTGKCLKCAIKKVKDGRGGSGYLANVGYGATKVSNPTPTSNYIPRITRIHRSTKLKGALKLKGVKSISSTVKSISKKMKFAKSVKKVGSKGRSLKSTIKSLL